MFYNNKSMVYAPRVINTPSYRTDNIFEGCSHLKVGPNTWGTTTTTGTTYNAAFKNCVSMISAPRVTNFQDTNSSWNKKEMFFGCGSLHRIEVDFTSWPSWNDSWIKWVGGNGIFVCPNALSHTSSDYTNNKIPQRWEIVTK